MSYYGTVADANAFFETAHVNGQLWLDQQDSRKQAALAHATRLMDNLNFAGDKNVSTQELEFPRGDDLVVPVAIEQACYLCAFALLDGRDPEYEAEQINEVQSFFGTARSRKDTTFMSEAKLHGIPSEDAWKLLKPFLRDGSEIIISRVS